MANPQVFLKEREKNNNNNNNNNNKQTKQINYVHIVILLFCEGIV